uniref:Uncharacterized protein n=1 Tax=Mustela putorius furo TaxID=9669 RepID=M3XY63_MUSPF
QTEITSRQRGPRGAGEGKRRRGRLPGGRGSWPRRPLGGRKKVLLRPPGPAEQVPPGRREAGAFALPVHSQLGSSPNFLFLFPWAEHPARDPALTARGGALHGRRRSGEAG